MSAGLLSKLHQLTLAVAQYPDVVDLVERMCEDAQAESLILDAEIVAIDPRDGSLKTFQELSNRARKDVKAADVTVAVCVFAFDLMCLDGQVSPHSPSFYFET